MKKTNFYVLRRRNAKISAELINGWSDGNFFYYRSDGRIWRAVHPGCGLAVCSGYTRKEAVETANTPEMTKRIAELWARDGEKLAAQFVTAIEQNEMGA